MKYLTIPIAANSLFLAENPSPFDPTISSVSSCPPVSFIGRDTCDDYTQDDKDACRPR
jgi:hypothetical protein